MRVPRFNTQKNLAQVGKKDADSQFWIGTMKVKENFFSLGSFTLQSGTPYTDPVL